MELAVILRGLSISSFMYIKDKLFSSASSATFGYPTRRDANVLRFQQLNPKIPSSGSWPSLVDDEVVEKMKAAPHSEMSFSHPVCWSTPSTSSGITEMTRPQAQ